MEGIDPLSIFFDALQELSGLAGLRYCCVADADAGLLLAEVGDRIVDPVVVLGWTGGATRFLDGPDDFDDLVLTTGHQYHLVRHVAAPPRRLLLYLCLDRRRANLAVARRQLAAVRLDTPVRIPEQITPATRGITPGITRWPARTANGPVPSAIVTDARPAAARPAMGVPAAVPAAVARTPPAAMPLPRRTAAETLPRPLPPRAAATGPAASGSGWATDVGTMKRLLVALRNLQ
ncbi:hypothetical protein [Pseudonocardia sp. GCM10023141]|uniref:hypothetical protein n=1 Tax=Pseudonocardia sp. GCM10023141 TaxID=3252653 RepID=UPI0036098016